MICRGCGRPLFDGERYCDACQTTHAIAVREHTDDYNDRHHGHRPPRWAREEVLEYRDKRTRGYA